MRLLSKGHWWECVKRLDKKREEVLILDIDIGTYRVPCQNSIRCVHAKTKCGTWTSALQGRYIHFCRVADSRVALSSCADLNRLFQSLPGVKIFFLSMNLMRYCIPHMFLCYQRGGFSTGMDHRG